MDGIDIELGCDASFGSALGKAEHADAGNQDDSRICGPHRGRVGQCVGLIIGDVIATIFLQLLVKDGAKFGDACGGIPGDIHGPNLGPNEVVGTTGA